MAKDTAKSNEILGDPEQLRARLEEVVAGQDVVRNRIGELFALAAAPGAGKTAAHRPGAVLIIDMPETGKTSEIMAAIADMMGEGTMTDSRGREYRPTPLPPLLLLGDPAGYRGYDASAQGAKPRKPGLH